MQPLTRLTTRWHNQYCLSGYGPHVLHGNTSFKIQNTGLIKWLIIYCVCQALFVRFNKLPWKYTHGNRLHNLHWDYDMFRSIRSRHRRSSYMGFNEKSKGCCQFVIYITGAIHGNVKDFLCIWIHKLCFLSSSVFCKRMSTESKFQVQPVVDLDGKGVSVNKEN